MQSLKQGHVVSTQFKKKKDFPSNFSFSYSLGNITNGNLIQMKDDNDNDAYLQVTCIRCLISAVAIKFKIHSTTEGWKEMVLRFRIIIYQFIKDWEKKAFKIIWNNVKNLVVKIRNINEFGIPSENMIFIPCNST